MEPTQKPFTFRVDPIRGTRSWGVTTDGTLTGLYYKQRWTPGENLARCRVEVEYIDDGEGRSWERHHYLTDETSKPIDDGHMVGCNCGFHAFFEGSLDYRSPNRVNGVVELYGRGILARRGARFTKARILALQIPPPIDPPPTLSDKSKLHAYRHRIGDPSLPAYCCRRLQMDGLTPDSAAAVRIRYAGLPIFDTFEELVDAFPLNPKEAS